MTMKVNLLLSLSSVVRTATERLRLELRGFHCKVPLHLSYLHIKFNNKI